MINSCSQFLCMANLDPNGPKFFGFSEFLAGLALMVLAWTIADTRYRFRVKTAPIPLEIITFCVVLIVGILTILTDLWRANGLPVIKGSLITPAEWQALLAAVYFSTFILWVWFAFIKPSTYGKTTCKRYVDTLYEYILKGSNAELAIIADELNRSANKIIFYATALDSFIIKSEHKKQNVEINADKILNFISDKRFCRAVVESSQNFILSLLVAIEHNKKSHVALHIFSKNIFIEAIKHHDSFLYHELGYYESGYIGEFKPISSVFFGNVTFIENMRITFDVGYGFHAWAIPEFEAYVRAASLFIKKSIQEGTSNNSNVFSRVPIILAECSRDLQQVNGVANSWDSVEVKRLKIVVKFIKDSIKEMDEKKEPFYHVLRNKNEDLNREYSIYDAFADAMYEVIWNASHVTNPWWDCWAIHRNTIYSSFFGSAGCASKVVQHKLRRKIYNVIVDLEKDLKYPGVHMLGFFLFVLGFEVMPKKSNKTVYALHLAILSWVRKNFKTLYAKNNDFGEKCLFATYSYDEENNRLVHVREARGIRKNDEYKYLKLDD